MKLIEALSVRVQQRIRWQCIHLTVVTQSIALILLKHVNAVCVFHSWSICLFVFKFETKQCDLQWIVIVSKNKGSQIRFQRHQSFQKWPIGECSMNFKCQMSNILETLKLWNVLFKNDFFLENSGLNKILDSVTIQFKSHVKKFRVKKTHK